MSTFTITINQVKNTSNSLTELNTQFKTMVQQLQDTAATLEGMWEGEAKSAFSTAFSNDITQMGNFYNAVVMFINALEEIITNYMNAESANVELAKNRIY